MTKIIKNPYIRVGTAYYKKIQHPLTSGDFISKLVSWNIQTIKHDGADEILAFIPKYDSFCIIPSHLNFKQVMGNSYNKYEPFEHIPKRGKCPQTLNFLKHIFSDQIEFGLDYLKLLLEKPTQILPILCLVSEDRNTGKTTFLNWLKAIFQGNMTINTNEDFRSQFNADWTTKLIIGVDETFLDKKEDSERIKNLSTSRNYKTESKGIDKIETEFFGKFILCSNNEENFIKIDNDEIRYWVRKIPKLKSDIINLLDELKIEIPCFLQYLVDRGFSTECKSRMWFTPQQIATEALKKVKKYNKTFLELELYTIIIEKLEDFGLEEICFTNQDLLFHLKESSIKTNKHQLGELLKNKWNLEPNKSPSNYIRYSFVPCVDGQIQQEEKVKGRYYTFKKNELLNIM